MKWSTAQNTEEENSIKNETAKLIAVLALFLSRSSHKEILESKCREANAR